MKISNFEKFVLFALAIILLIFILGTVRNLLVVKEGITQGTLVDASVEGSFIKSCEIDIQYGKESSRIESYSYKEPYMCKHFKKHVGKPIKVSYRFSRLNFTTNTNYIIQSIEVVDGHQ